MSWLERLRPARRRVLFTVQWIEHPPAGGPFLRTQNSLKALTRIAEVHLVSRQAEAPLGGPRAREYFSRLCASLEFAPSLFPGSGITDAEFVVAAARRRGADVVWFGHGQDSYPLMKAVRALAPELLLVGDTDSVWSRFIARALPYATSAAERERIRAETARKEAEEADWVDFCDVTTAVSEVDADYYRGLASRPRKILPFANVIDLADYRVVPPRPAELPEPYLFFAGYFGPGSPTDHAARWFVREALPRVAAARPGIRLVVAGKDSRETLADLDDPRLTVLGRLDSLQPYLRHAAVSLVPLWFESGTRFKILEAGACEVPVVSTTLGAEGLPVTSGEELLLADDPEAFAAAVLRLLDDPALGRRLARRLRRLVERRFSVETLVEQGRAVLAALPRSG